MRKLNGGHFIYEKRDSDKVIEHKSVKNALADEGEKDILDVLFSGGTDGNISIGASDKNYFWFKLFNDTPTETDSYDDLINEPSGNGYQTQRNRPNQWEVGYSHTTVNFIFTDRQDLEDVTIAFVNTGSLSVVVTVHDVVVNIQAGVTTAEQIKAAIEASASASVLLIVDYASGETGIGTPAAFAEELLDGIPYAHSPYERFTAEGGDWGAVTYSCLFKRLRVGFDNRVRLLSYSAVPSSPLTLTDGQSLFVKYRINFPFFFLEGQKAMLQTYFKGGIDGDNSQSSSSGRFITRLFNDNTHVPVAGDSYSDLTGEPVSTESIGYKPKILERTTNDWSIAIDTGDYMATSRKVRFMNTDDIDGDDWTVVELATLSLETSSGEYLVDKIALEAGAIILLPGETNMVIWNIKAQ